MVALVEGNQRLVNLVKHRILANSAKLKAKQFQIEAELQCRLVESQSTPGIGVAWSQLKGLLSKVRNRLTDVELVLLDRAALDGCSIKFLANDFSVLNSGELTEQSVA